MGNVFLAFLSVVSYNETVPIFYIIQGVNHMKKITMLLIIATLGFVLSGFCFIHDWEPATCTSRSTCSKCGETRGDTKEHEYGPMNCGAEVTCENCGKTKTLKSWSGKKPDHNWTEATCTEPKTCQVCDVTMGKPHGHVIANSNCITKGTCRRCGFEESNYGPHDWGLYEKVDQTMVRQCSVCQKVVREALDWKIYGRQMLNGRWVGVKGNTWTGSGKLEDTYFTVSENGKVIGKLQGDSFNYDSVKYLRSNQNEKGEITSVVYGFGKEGYLGSQEVIYHVKSDTLSVVFFNGSGQYERDKK